MTNEQRSSPPSTATDLKARIEAAKRERDAKIVQPADRTSAASGWGRAMRMSTEFVSAIAAGGLVGWGFDQWLGTTPWGLIICFGLGFAAGILNVVRAAQTLQANAQADQTADDETTEADRR